MKPILLFIVLLIAFSAKAQFDNVYHFLPKYSLPGSAANLPGNVNLPPESRFSQFKLQKETPLFHGKKATEIIDQFIEKPLQLPFSLEFAVVHHFNKEAGLVFYLGGENGETYSISYFSEKDREPVQVGFYHHSENEEWLSETVNDHYQKYWHQFALTFDRNELKLYHNGELVSTKDYSFEETEFDLKIAAYLDAEPHAGIGNIVPYVKTYYSILKREEVEDLCKIFKKEIEEGVYYSNLFHFNAGPYLHFATQSSINILWETNQNSSGVIEYGESLPLKNKMEVQSSSEPPFITEVTLNGLKPDTPYFYNVILKNKNGEEMESGLLSFRTSSDDNYPILFGVIGDTEARPHINDQVSKKLWSEKPDLVLLLGDLTDGGMKDAKWQWNLEYFVGMSQLFSRIPVYPVPGNGEGDLFWYKKYHKLPNGEAYYTFRNGPAGFFMLNSNERKSEFSPGGIQYQWLDSALQQSKAKWKFVALHHAPYSTDENDYGDSYKEKSNLGDEQVKTLIPLFEKHHVDAVFFGHLHSYNRIGPINNNQFDSQNGVWYIQAGGAGGNPEDFAPNHNWFSQKSYSGHHYSTVSLSNDQFILKTYNLDGALIDYLTIEK